MSPIDRGPRGTAGSDGNSIRAVFYDSINQPSPTGATYDGTTFTPPTGSSAVIPDPLINNLWMQLYELRDDLDPERLDNLGLTQLNGPRGPPGNDGTDGADGADGAIGPMGATGSTGADGTNGYSSQIIFRKTFAIELLESPTVTYDGTSLTLPTTENNAWQLTPYSSRIQGSFELHADNTSPKDIDVDTGVQPHIVYLLDDAGQFVYRYQETGAYIDRWALDPTNDTAEALDVQGNLVRVLDTQDRGPSLNQYNQVFVYSKSDGGRQTGIEFRVPRAGSPILKGITTEGDSIYILTETSIRRFDITSRMEQTTGVLSSLRSSPVDPDDNVDPEGSDANAYYFITLDPNRRKAFVRDINTLSLRHRYREWSLGAQNDSPQGISITEYEVYVLNTRDNRVYKYYNPDNILWGSVLEINNNPPYDVTERRPIDMTGRRGEGGIVVQGTGTGRDGTNGEDGRSFDIVYREVASGSSLTTPPTGGAANDGTITTAPNDWHLTSTAAKTAFGSDGDLYVSVLRIDRDGSTISSYGEPIKITGEIGPQGPQGIPGTAAAAGNSVEFIYRPDTDTPTAPTGGNFASATRTFTPPAGWTLNPPGTVADNQNLYIIESVLPCLLYTSPSPRD